MLVSEFVKEYQQSKQKNAFIKKHIKTNYIPYTTKIDIAKSIVNVCMYKEVNGTRLFVQNSPARYHLFIQGVVNQYTDLEWDKAENGDDDFVKGFDLLEENGLVEGIFVTIGDDIQKFMTVLNMVVDDEVDMNRSVVSFFETKVESVSILLDTILKAFEDPRIKNKISNFIEKK